MVKFSEGTTSILKFTVLDCECPTILGMPFLRKTNPEIDWSSGKIIPKKIKHC